MRSATLPSSSLSRRLAVWIALIALISVAAFAGGKPPRDALYKYSIAGDEIVLYAILLLATLAIARSTALFALRRPESWRRALGLTAIVLVLVYAATFGLDQVLHGSREQGLVPQHWEPAHAGAYAANFVVIAAVAPVVEELLFRGLGFSLLVRYGRWVAIVVVALAFGAYHGLPRALPELALFGGALAWLRARTGSVFPGMLAHATLNSIALASVFF